MLTVSLLVCSMIALARANDNVTAEVEAEGSRSSSDEWSYSNRTEYLFVKTARDWADAEKNCLSKNAHLASVHNEEDYKFMQDLVRLKSGKDADTWIGATDCQKKNLWFWSDGSNFDFIKWSRDANLDDGSCVRMNYQTDKNWDAASCTELKSSVCSRPA